MFETFKMKIKKVQILNNLDSSLTINSQFSFVLNII